MILYCILTNCNAHQYCMMSWVITCCPIAILIDMTRITVICIKYNLDHNHYWPCAFQPTVSNSLLVTDLSDLFSKPQYQSCTFPLHHWAEPTGTCRHNPQHSRQKGSLAALQWWAPPPNDSVDKTSFRIDAVYVCINIDTFTISQRSMHNEYRLRIL